VTRKRNFFVKNKRRKLLVSRLMRKKRGFVRKKRKT